MERNADGTPRWNNEYYGLAIPQAYVEAGTDALSVKVGHFYSPVGYEGVMAPYNFFYSKSYSYQFAGPFTHWGGMLTWKPNDCWQVQLALHNGWDALDRTVDILVHQLRSKLEADPKRPRVIRTVRGAGYVLAAEVTLG